MTREFKNNNNIHIYTQRSRQRERDRKINKFQIIAYTENLLNSLPDFISYFFPFGPQI